MKYSGWRWRACSTESEQFQRRLNRYRERYLFPDENVTETEDKQA